MGLPKGIIPEPGQILLCDFGPDPRSLTPPGTMHGPLSVPPEIYKLRPVIVVAGRPGLATVVPLSTKAPALPRRYHVRLPAGAYEVLDASQDSWVKGDLVTTVSSERLDRPRVAGRHVTVRLQARDLRIIRAAILHGLGLGVLTIGLADTNSWVSPVAIPEAMSFEPRVREPAGFKL